MTWAELPLSHTQNIFFSKYYLHVSMSNHNVRKKNCSRKINHAPLPHLSISNLDSPFTFQGSLNDQWMLTKALLSVSFLKEQPFPAGKRKEASRQHSVQLEFEQNPQSLPFLSFSENAMCLWLTSVRSEVELAEKHSFQ